MFLFTFVLVIGGFAVPDWFRYIVLLIFAWKAFTICQVRNSLIDAEDEDAKALNTFTFAAFAMSDLLVGTGTVYAGIVGLYIGVTTLLSGAFLRVCCLFLLEHQS